MNPLCVDGYKYNYRIIYCTSLTLNENCINLPGLILSHIFTVYLRSDILGNICK